MLLMQFLTTERFFSLVSDVNFDNSTKSKLIENFDNISQSNQNVFNMLLPLFGAWVGAVVAFYFGAKNLDAAHKATEKAQSALQAITSKNPGNTTLDKLLKLHPESTDVKKAKLEDSIKKILEELKTFGNVVLVDDKEEPQGVIYETPIIDYLFKVREDENGEQKYKETIKNQLKDVISDIFDPITEKKWKVKKLENYATLSYEDTLIEVKNKMDKIKPGEPDLLGLVIVDKVVKAAINSETLSRAFN